MSVREKFSRSETLRGRLAHAVADPSWVGWALFAGCGAVAAVMGLTGSAGRALEGGPAARLMAHMPDPLVALALGAGCLTALAVLWLLLPRGIRRRKKDEEEYELYQEPPKVPTWILIVVWAVLLLPFAGVGYLLWQGWTPFGQDGAPLSAARPPSFLHGRRFSPYGGPAAVVSPAFWSVGVTALTLCAAFGSLVFVVWILFGDRLAWWWAGPLLERRSELLAEAVSDSLDDLAREPDARIAIIKCYRRFEQVLARSGVPRAPWQAPMEFMRAALGKLPLPPQAVQRLTGLFEIARFSNEPLGPSEHATACESLGEIHLTLGREKADVSTP